MEFDFAEQEGTGIEKLIPNASPDVTEIIVKMLMYDQAQRMSASQALKHPFFKDLRDAEYDSVYNPRRIRIGDSQSQQSKSIISKISDNASEGSYQNDAAAQKAQGQPTNEKKFKKQDAVVGNFELGRKTQTFHSDMEENYAAGGQNQPALPPIFKKQSKKHGGLQLPVVGGQQLMQMTSSQFGGSHASNLTTFNATKKNFPQLNKLTTHKKSYISPYSIKSIPKQ